MQMLDLARLLASPGIGEDGARASEPVVAHAIVRILVVRKLKAIVGWPP